MIMGITFFDFLRDRLSFEQARLKPARFFNLVQLAWQVRRERNQLASLSREELRQMGIHPVDAEHEAKRGLLDLPKSRLDRV